jgi:hypothetical protein
MQVFFKTEEEIKAFLSKLTGLCCPACRAVDTLVRHGVILWQKGRKAKSIRAWRVRCKDKTGHKGCGHAPSIRLGNTLPRRYFDTDELWAFARQLLNARSIKNAWERSGLPMSLDTAYRLYHRMTKGQSALRTRLSGLSPPPESKARVPLLHVLAHLKEVFGGSSPISAYQLSFQQDFLGLRGQTHNHVE